MAERTRDLVAAALIALSLVVVVVVLAGSEPGEADRTRALASRLGCPVCESESIADSPSPIARDLYDLIGERVAEGWSDDEVVAFFVAIYGEQVLLDPPFDARTLALWLIPLAAAVAGLAVIATRRTRVADRALTDEQRRRLHVEVQARKES